MPIFIVGIILLNLPILSIHSEDSIQIYRTDWKMLKIELEICKAQLINLDKQIQSLKDELLKATELQKNYEILQNDYETRIQSLKTQLAELEKERASLQILVQSLEDQSKEALKLLENTKNELQKQTQEIEIVIFEWESKYRKEIQTRKIVIYGLASFVFGFGFTNILPVSQDLRFRVFLSSIAVSGVFIVWNFLY